MKWCAARARLEVCGDVMVAAVGVACDGEAADLGTEPCNAIITMT